MEGEARARGLGRRDTHTGRGRPEAARVEVVREEEEGAVERRTGEGGRAEGEGLL